MLAMYDADANARCNGVAGQLGEGGIDETRLYEGLLTSLPPGRSRSPGRARWPTSCLLWKKSFSGCR